MANTKELVQKLSAIDPASFDWTAFQSSYKGRALITRLLHIPSLILSAPSPPLTSIQLAREALLRLIPLVKETWDHRLYLRVVQWLEWTSKPEMLARRSSAAAKQGAALMPIDGAVGVGGVGEGEKGKSSTAGGDDMAIDDEDEEEGGGEGDDEGIKSLSGSFLKEGKEEDGVPDVEWVESARESERKEVARLDVELRGYMSNLIKESIRLTYLAFAQLALKCGNFESAMKHYNSAREYSTSPQHHVELGEGLVDACLKFGRTYLLNPHLSKLSSSLDRQHPPPSSSGPGTDPSSSSHPSTLPGGLGGIRDAQAITQADLAESREANQRAMRVRRGVGAKLRVGRTMSVLAAAGAAASARAEGGTNGGGGGGGNSEGDWEKAGREAGEVLEEGGLGVWEGQCISSSDLALICFLCTLSTAPRDRIRRLLLDRTSFREALADSQSWVLDLVRSFLGASYGSVSSVLAAQEPLLILNPVIGPYVTVLLGMVRTKSIVDYVAPYSAVKLERMAQALEMQVEEMERVLEGLVERGEIQGKLDGVDGVLSLKQSALRSQLQQRAQVTSREVVDRSTGALLNMMLRQNHIVVDPRPDDLKRSTGPMYSRHNGDPGKARGGAGDFGAAGAFGGAVGSAPRRLGPTGFNAPAGRGPGGKGARGTDAGSTMLLEDEDADLDGEGEPVGFEDEHEEEEEEELEEDTDAREEAEEEGFVDADEGEEEMDMDSSVPPSAGAAGTSA